MNRSALVAVVLLLLTGGVQAREGAGGPLTLAQAIRTALAQRPRLRALEQRRQEAQARTEEARSEFFPRVDAGGIAKRGLSGSGGAFGLTGLAGSPEPKDDAVSGNIFYEFLDFGRRRHHLQARRFEMDALSQDVLAEQARVRLEVKEAYFEALARERLVPAAGRKVKEQQLALRRARVLAGAGLASGLDLERSGVGLARAKLEQVHARHALEEAFDRLRHAMGVSDATRYTLQDVRMEEKPAGPLEPLLAEGLDSRPEVLAQEARVKAYQEWLERARRDLRPSFMAAFSGGFTRFPTVRLSRLLFGGLGIHQTFFEGGRLRAQVREAAARLARERAAREELKQNIRLEIRRAYRALANSREEMEARSAVVRHAAAALKLARLRRREGLADALEEAGAETARARAQAESARARYHYLEARAELDFATGR